MTGRQKGLYTGVLLCAIVYLSFAGALRGSLLSSMIDFYDLADSQQGLPSAVASFGSMLAMFLSFALMGRIKKPTLLIVSFGCVALLLLPQYLKPAFGAFIALNLLFGVALGVMDTLISSSMADIHAGKRAALMMSLLHAFYGIGGILSPMLYSALLQNGVAWNGVFLVLAGIGAAFLIYMTPVSLRQSRLPLSAQIQASGRITLAGVRAYFANRALASLTGLMLFFGLFFGGLVTWITRFVELEYRSPLSGVTLSLVFLGVTAARLVTPLTGIKQAAYLKIAGIAAWALLSAGLFTGSGVATLVLIALASLLSGCLIPFAINLACERNRENTMLASTMLLLALYVGQTVSAPLIGAIEARAGLKAAMEVCYLFAAAASLCAVFGMRNKREA